MLVSSDIQSLPVHRKTKVYCLLTIGLAADKDENLLLIVGTHWKCTTFLNAYKTLNEC